MVVDKQQKTVWDRCGNPSKHQHQKPGEVPGTEGTTGAEVEGNRIVRTCNPKTGRMAPADFRHNGLVAIVDAGVGGVMVWGILLACFGHLPTEYYLYITTYLRIAHLHAFMIKEGVQCIVESMPQRNSGKKFWRQKGSNSVLARCTF